MIGAILSRHMIQMIYDLKELGNMLSAVHFRMVRHVQSGHWPTTRLGYALALALASTSKKTSKCTTAFRFGLVEIRHKRKTRLLNLAVSEWKHGTRENRHWRHEKQWNYSGSYWKWIQVFFAIRMSDGPPKRDHLTHIVCDFASQGGSSKWSSRAQFVISQRSN